VRPPRLPRKKRGHSKNEQFFLLEGVIFYSTDSKIVVSTELWALGQSFLAPRSGRYTDKKWRQFVICCNVRIRIHFQYEFGVYSL